MLQKERKKRGAKPKPVSDKKKQRSVTATDDEWVIIVNKAKQEDLDTSTFIIRELVG